VCQETSEFACGNDEHVQFSKSTLLTPLGALEDPEESFDQVFTKAMSEIFAEDNVDCPNCTRKELRSVRVEPVVWPQPLLVQSVREPMSRQPMCHFPTCVNMDDHIFRLRSFIFIVCATDANRHYVEVVRTLQNHWVEYNNSLVSE
jgi:hypothetical protein